MSFKEIYGFDIAGNQKCEGCVECKCETEEYQDLSERTRQALEHYDKMMEGVEEMMDSEVARMLDDRGDKIVIDTTYGHPLFYQFIQDMAHIHGIKNRDYGGGDPLGNFKGVLAMGMPPVLGILVRMTDKWSRILSLVKQGGTGQVKDESLLDTLIDLANYSLLTCVLFKLYGLGVDLLETTQ